MGRYTYMDGVTVKNSLGEVLYLGAETERFPVNRFRPRNGKICAIRPAKRGVVVRCLCPALLAPWAQLTTMPKPHTVRSVRAPH